MAINMIIDVTLKIRDLLRQPVQVGLHGSNELELAAGLMRLQSILLLLVHVLEGLQTIDPRT